MMICRNFMGTANWKDYKLFYVCTPWIKHMFKSDLFLYKVTTVPYFLLLYKICVYINVFWCVQGKVDEKRKREILILTHLIRFKYIYHKTQDITNEQSKHMCPFLKKYPLDDDANSLMSSDKSSESSLLWDIMHLDVCNKCNLQVIKISYFPIEIS